MPIDAVLQKDRRALGLCVQCGVPTDLNRHGKPLARCPLHLREQREHVAHFHARHFRGETALDESRAYLRFFAKLAGKRKPVSDIRQIVHLRPTGSYVTELLGNRVIR